MNIDKAIARTSETVEFLNSNFVEVWYALDLIEFYSLELARHLWGSKSAQARAGLAELDSLKAAISAG